MVRGLYIAGTGMMLQRRRMENITNNIANADTTGFKKENLVSHSFDAVMIERINDSDLAGQARVFSQARLVGPLNLGTQVDQLYIDFTQGSLEGTERSTDLALVDNPGSTNRVFFAVQTEAGERYARSGAFYVDSAGWLTDGEGNYLLSEGGGQLNVGGMNFLVDETGGVYNADGGAVGRVRVVRFAEDEIPGLRKQGSNLYYHVDGLAPAVAGPNDYGIRQGFLETSNVDVAREMVDMLTVFRTYETNQRMITMIDETVGKAVNEIGRLR